MQGKRARGEDGVDGGEEVHVVRFILFVQLTHGY